MGKRPRLGTKAKALIESKEELLRYIKRAFEYYLANGLKKERFGHTLDRIGVKKAVQDIMSGEVRERVGSCKRKPAAPAVKKNFLDLRGVCCPLNFVKAKLAMDKIKSGETIEFYLDDGEPIVNVTRSLKDEGHQVLLVTPRSNYFALMVEKKS